VSARSPELRENRPAHSFSPGYSLNPELQAYNSQYRCGVQNGRRLYSLMTPKEHMIRMMRSLWYCKIFLCPCPCHGDKKW
jgi:hypothetical protein